MQESERRNDNRTVPPAAIKVPTGTPSTTGPSSARTERRSERCVFPRRAGNAGGEAQKAGWCRMLWDRRENTVARGAARRTCSAGTQFLECWLHLAECESPNLEQKISHHTRQGGQDMLYFRYFLLEFCWSRSRPIEREAFPFCCANLQSTSGGGLVGFAAVKFNVPQLHQVPRLDTPSAQGWDQKRKESQNKSWSLELRGHRCNINHCRPNAPCRVRSRGEQKVESNLLPY